ncbi:hypothetical protein [Sinomicrobium sp. M5D2P9]
MKNNIQSRVEIFKTNVQDDITADSCILALSLHFSRTRFNFDLEDCDRILRVEGYHIDIDKIITLLKSMHIHCCMFTD